LFAKKMSPATRLAGGPPPPPPPPPQGDILEDIELIENLEQTKRTSIDIEEKVKLAKVGGQAMVKYVAAAVMDTHLLNNLVLGEYQHMCLCKRCLSSFNARLDPADQPWLPINKITIAFPHTHTLR
jgi:hypothetical protein